MKGHFAFRRQLVAGGTCLLLIGLLMSSLVGAVGPWPALPAGLTSPAAGEAAPAVVPSRTGSRSTQVDPPDAKRAVREAWEKAQDAGVYTFATNLTQVIYPSLSLANVGRGPERSELHLEGEIDQPARTLEFRISQPGAAGSGTTGGAEARIEGDRAYVRQAGGEWQEVEDFSGSFAPDNDPLAFLAGVKEIGDCGLQARAGAPEVASSLGEVACYGFRLDGPALAGYLRDQMERQLAGAGALPLGATLEVSREFREMGGNGELWVDGRGLPLRLAMHLTFPEQADGSHLDADIQTDFSGFPEETAAVPDVSKDPVAAVGAALGLDDPSLPAKAAQEAGTASVLACTVGALALLLVCHRSRKMYIAVAVAVTASLVVVPLLQAEQAAAYYDRQAERLLRSQDLMSLASNGQVVDAQSVQELAETWQAAADRLSLSWDSQQDPLAQPAQAAADQSALARISGQDLALGLQASSSSDAPASDGDTGIEVPECNAADTDDPDEDGVSDYDECNYLLYPNDADSDDDGLSDGQELHKLGTDGNSPDTDGDVITDTVEVEGFWYNGRQWYLNPKNPDTNNDGVTDSLECPALLDIANPTETDIRDQCDTDKDGVPNPFDDDNDGDGVPDRVDLSPAEWADATGQRSGQVSNVVPFSSDSPFALTLQNLQAGWPVLVDMQMRPQTPEHLGYAMNVLDWPAPDVDGQIQRGKVPDTTFATSDNPDIKNPEDTAGGHGDMRLIPLLEIVMTGWQIPLKLTEPAATFQVGTGTALSSTVTLAAGSDPANTEVSWELPTGASLAFYDGTCPGSGSPLGTFPGSSDTLPGRVVSLADGNHSAVVTVDTESACADLPDVVNGPYTDKMVDLSMLDPYGITAHDENEGGVNSVVVYVPLSVVSDDTGGGKSAFQSHMIYWTDGGDSAWLEPQQMRIIWLVQMLTDSCSEDVQSYDEFEADYKADHPHADDADINDAYNKYYDTYCAAHRTVDEIVPVQVYDESWTLAGLSVREDHGLDVAVGYVNPSLTEYDDDALWTLSWGLGQQFVEQIDCEQANTDWNGDESTCKPDGKRDLTVFLSAPTTDHSVHDIGNSTIEQRFDITTTATITDRWSIDGVPFPLVVDSYRYDNQDYLAYLSMTETPGILDQFLNKYGQTATPTILYAREERYRMAGLEATTEADAAGFTVDVNPTTYAEETLAGLQWQPYRYGTDGWEAYPATEYWDVVGDELEARFYELYPADSEEANLGRVVMARAYDFALMNGVVNTVHCTPDEPLCQVGKHADASNEWIIKASKDLAGGLNVATTKSFQDYFGRRDYVKKNNLTSPKWSDLGNAVRNQRANWDIVFGEKAPSSISAMGGIVCAAAGIAMAATAVLAAAMGIEGGQIAAVIIREVSVGVSTHCVIHTIAAQWKTFARDSKPGQGFLSFSWGKMGSDVKLSRAVKAGLVSTCVTIAITWAAFVTQFYVTDMKWGSMGTDSAFATAIADTLTGILLFAIFTALGPIGAIAGALVGMLNAIANAICSALPTEMQKSKTGSWLCRGINGIVSNLLKRLFYSGTIMVTVGDEGRLSLHNFDSELVDEEAGVVTGNQMRYSIGLTNTLDLVDTPVNHFEVEYYYQFSDDTLGMANFDYKWQQAQNAFHSGLELGGMTPGWDRTGGRPFTIAKERESDPIPLPAAGINRPVGALYFSEAYAVPVQECWSFVPCDIETERSTSHFDMGSDLIYDVLPATLTGFYQLARKGDGWALAWGQDGNLTFPMLYDADGDGLSWADDPDDSNWDADGDGLSDEYELNNDSDPLLRDTDDDGLTDHQEAQFGTDPRSPDGDGDGLLDCQEVFHQVEAVGDDVAQDACGNVVGAWSGGWTIVYGMDAGTQLSTLVTPNPADVDGDGDGLTDSQEKVYGYNPGVYSILNVLSLESELSEPGGMTRQPTDGFVAPGQTLYYTATVQNPLDNREAKGLVWSEASPVLDASSIKPQPFDLRPQTQAAMSGDLEVISTATTGVYSLTQVAGALIVDPAVESGGASLWLSFDGSYADSSGRIPAHDGSCSGATGCTVSSSGGKSGGAVTLGGTSYVNSDATIPKGPYGVSFWLKTQATAGVLFASKTTVGAKDRVKIYLQDGKICAEIPGEIACTRTTYTDNAWHHVAHTDRGSGIGGQMLYLDGVLAAPWGTEGDTWDVQAGVVLGGRSGSTNLVGSIDDVRLFEHTLSEPEVQALAQLSLFHMDFDQTNAWKDVSSFNTTIESRGASHDSSTAARGSAASLDGTTYLLIYPAPQLYLTGGRFTLSAWIYPRLHGDSRDTSAQGILGYQSGTANAYPALQRVGKKIRFGVGTGSQWKAVTTSTDVLRENQWNHVAVTLNKDEGGNNLRFYVNGELVETAAFAISSISELSIFEIGRSNYYGRLELSYIYVNDAWDGAAHCYSGYVTDSKADLCMAMNAQQVMSFSANCDYHAPCPGYSYPCPTLPQGVDFRDKVDLQMWDDDGGNPCGPVPDSDDDQCKLTAANDLKLTFTTNQAGFDSAAYTWQNGCDSSGTYKLKFVNDSVPFHGNMDELQIFGQALDGDAITQLYLDVATDLHLPLDEAPGAVAFEDQGLSQVAVSCSGSTCPTSGTAGRLNQAAWFDGTDDYLDASTAPAASGTGPLSVAAWIRTRAAQDQVIVNQRSATMYNGEYMLTTDSNGKVSWFMYGNDGAADHALTSLKAVNDGQWHHVVAVREGDGTFRIYIDGALDNSDATPSTIASLVPANVYVGADVRDHVRYFSGTIDDVWVFGIALSSTQVATLYQRAPALHLRFEEAHGATQFADNASSRDGTCSSGGCPVTGEAIRGQVGLAAQFDGVDDSVSVPNFGSFTQTTVSAWVYRTGATTTREAIASYKLQSTCGSVLSLNEDGTNQLPRFWVYVGGWKYAEPSATTANQTPLNQWMYLTGTYDGHSIRLYRNGVQVAETAAEGSMGQCEITTTIGNDGLYSHYFPGAIDEVQIYARALTASEIRDRYDYESAWVEDRQSRDLTVDADEPTAQVLIDEGTHLANQATVVGVTASDPTSDVSMVELGVQKGTGTISWTPVARCTDNEEQPAGAWCGEFVPSGQGAYTLYARATDRVGNSPSDPPGMTVYVDDTPPSVSLTQTFGQLVYAVPSGEQEKTWLVQLSGTVSDPDITADVPGSGVPADGVRVTLRDPEGKVLGASGQTATLSGSAWSLQYAIGEVEPDGWYHTEVEAVDTLGASPALSPDQADRHTTVAATTIALDAAAPDALLDSQPAIIGGQLGPGVTSLGGAVSDHTVPVEIDVTPTKAGDKMSVWLSCVDYGTGKWYDVFDLPAGTMMTGDAYHWKIDIQQGITCNLDATTTEPAGWSESVKVCGTQVTEWSTDFGQYARDVFTADSRSCSKTILGTRLLMHLDEEYLSTQWYDSSGNGYVGACSGDECPTAGVGGQVNRAALFDGVNDRIAIPHNASFDAIEDLDRVTIAAWVYINAWYNGWFLVVDKYEGSGDIGWHFQIHSTNGLNFHSGTATAPSCAPVPPTRQWVHVAVTYDRSTGKIQYYVNGVQQCETSFTGDIKDTAGEPLYLGYNPSGGDEYSNGRLDEVAVYDRALSAQEIDALYQNRLNRTPVAGVQGVDVAFRSVLPGSAFTSEAPPADEVLHLPFEDTPDRNGGLAVHDASGGDHDGACDGGSDACPVFGQAGPSGSAALFDGVNDTITVTHNASFDAVENNDKVTMAAWVKVHGWSFGYFPIIDKYEATNDTGWAFGAHNSMGLWINTGQSSTTCGYVPPLDQWVHVAVSYDRSANTAEFYANGVRQCARALSGDIIDTLGEPLYVGSHPTYADDEQASGMIDEVRMFSRALTAGEIKALYLGSGPVLALSFDQPWATEGTILPDASGWAHDGTLHTGTGDAANKAVPGQVGSYALQFDGANYYAEIPHNPAFDAIEDLDKVTIAAWVKVHQWYSNYFAIIDKYEATGDYGWSFGAISTLGLFINAGGPTSYVTCSYVPPLDQWVHVVVSYDRSAGKALFYVNGVQKCAPAFSSDIIDTSGEPLYVGYNPSGGNDYSNGSIDEVRIYPRALSVLEVADLYHAGWQAATLGPSGAGVEYTSWAVDVLSGLEGSYQVEMRGRDVAGHAGATVDSSLVWRGEADNTPPRVTVTRADAGGGKYTYTTVAEDYDLVDPSVAPAGYASPCGTDLGTLTKENYQSPWYLGRTDAVKLFRLTAVCTTTNANAQATVCDTFGNCNTCDMAGSCTTSVVPSDAAGSPQVAESSAVGVSGASVLSKAAPGAKPGPALFDISAAAVVRTSNYYEPRIIGLDGLVTSRRPAPADPHDLASVQVTIGDETGLAILSEPAAQRPYTVTWTFPWQLPRASELPDGLPYTAIITATDKAGRTTVLNHDLTADVVLPTPVTLALTANGVRLEPGATVREAGVDLALSWTPSSDGSGLAPYLAGWRFEDAYTTTVQTSLHDPAGPLEADATAAEAQRVSVGLASRDRLGNDRYQAFGSVIVDGPLTPDYIALGGLEGDITGSSCTLLGADRRIDPLSTGGRWTAQRLYGTWDQQALRLAWTGANWSGDGDLFVYLDTGPGGTTTTLSPYAVGITGTLVSLPPYMQADALIWVQDSGTASLLRWDGSAWGVDTALSTNQYRFDGGRNGGQTDLYLPFELLGTAAGASLGLLAFAAEEPVPDVGLRLWATLPLANPLNSDRVNPRLGLAPAGSRLPLLHAYGWAALGDGVCPNGTNGVLLARQHNDAVLDLRIESDPPGAATGGLAGGLFWVIDPAASLGAADAEARFGLLHPAQPPVADGQVIRYTVHYRNQGRHTLQGAWLALSAHGPLQLATDSLELGNLPPGAEGTVTFQATTDRSLAPLGPAAVLVGLHAATNGQDGPPLEWLAAIHRVDHGAPEVMSLNRLEVVVGPAVGWLRGSATDESGIGQLEIEVTPPSGPISTMSCDVPDSASGGWSCPWDATAANGGVSPADGDQFSVRLRAIDRLGNPSGWSEPHLIRVDAQPPTVTLGIEPGHLVRGNSVRLIGRSGDNHAVGTVTICRDEGGCQSADVSSPDTASTWWSRWITLPGDLDYVTRTLTIEATDRLGNRTTEPLTLPVVFDNVPPVLVADQLLVQVPLGSALTVLSGEVADGGRGVDVSVRVQPPHGDIMRQPAARDEALWWFDLPAEMPGQYRLWADAKDVAGNVTSSGPFTVTITCTDAKPIVMSLSAEPVAGWPMSLTLTVVLSNAGPEPLPAGLPVVLDDGITPVGRVTTTRELAAGESEALSIVWAPGFAGDHDIGVTPGHAVVSPNGPLCVAPGMARSSLPVLDTPLFWSWNLISPQVDAGNTAAEVVQRGIDGEYSAILSYDGGLKAYYPSNPGDSDLTTVDALHGYWVQTMISPTATLTDTISDHSPATWRMTGETVPEDQPLSLAEGWNLVGYLPRQPLTVTAALAGIDGQYGAVLGFQRTAISYYPDLDPSYNTLGYMAPGYGYWISTTQAATLAYRVTTLSDTVSMTPTKALRWQMDAVRLAEWQAGVQPTYEWANFYGPASLRDGTPIPAGTVVVAVDPDNTVCGATVVWQPGQFGLLACYADDPQSIDIDEGAVPGDLIELFISTDGTQPDAELIGTGMWMAHGGRWGVGQEVQPVVDLAITKEVVPQEALPGETITYILHYWNGGDAVAQGVVINDVVPAEIEVTGITYAGAEIVPVDGGQGLAWQVADLEPGASGTITITALLSPELTGPLDVTNTATINAPLEVWPEDNVAQAVLHVSEVEEAPPPVVDLVITKEVLPREALPGTTITYTLRYWNAGGAMAQGVVIHDALPVEIAVTGITYSGAEITPVDGGEGLVWQVADLEPGASGIITLTAVVSPALTGPLDVTNTAIISAPLEARPEDNVAEAVLQVIQGLVWLWRRIVRGPL